MQLPGPPRAGTFERMLQRLIMVRGVPVILWNQLKRRLGYSYYATLDPWVAGLSSVSYTYVELLRTFYVPAWYEGEWSAVGKVLCPSGRLIVTDPGEFPNPSPAHGVIVDNVPTGAHPLELQVVRFGRGYGRLVMRARLLWGQIDNPDFECLGGVGVGLAAVSIADGDETSRLTYEQVQAAGFDALDLLGEEIDYQCVDPLGGNNRFFWVFRSGLGDGCYPVLHMRCNGRSCGILIDMTGLLCPDDPIFAAAGEHA